MSLPVRIALVGVALCLRTGVVNGDPPTHDETLDASEADDAEPKSERTPWNEVDLRLLTVRVGVGTLLDYSAFDQDAASHDQGALSANFKLRDFRFLFKGHFAFAPDRLTYTIGYMYDGTQNTWHFRQTGLMLDIPELGGDLFIGRTKEGFSTNKIMVGYNGWTMERAAVNDAFIPILGDGLKWTGHVADGHIVYNAGWFIDTLSETESFNKNDRQFAARVVGLPLARDSDTVLHLAAEIRVAASDDGMLQYRSKPESFEAQSYAVDTGKFPADHSITYGLEAYYRPGPLTFGAEYFWNKVSSSETRDPLFQGGEVFVSYLLTGEIRPYNDRGAFFVAVSPTHAVFAGGPGAWEVTLRYSQVNLDSGTISGGKFWRVTPVLSWYLSNNVRFELEYGYSITDRDGLEGVTQYFQSRLQFNLM